VGAWAAVRAVVVVAEVEIVVVDPAEALGELFEHATHASETVRRTTKPAVTRRARTVDDSIGQAGPRSISARW
jgi:hypothetical protein